MTKGQEKISEKAQVDIAEYLGLDLVQWDGSEIETSVESIATEDMRALEPDPFEGDVIRAKALDMDDYLLVNFMLDSGYKVKLKIDKT